MANKSMTSRHDALAPVAINSDVTRGKSDSEIDVSLHLLISVCIELSLISINCTPRSDSESKVSLNNLRSTEGATKVNCDFELLKFQEK